MLSKQALDLSHERQPQSLKERWTSAAIAISLTGTVVMNVTEVPDILSWILAKTTIESDWICTLLFYAGCAWSGRLLGLPSWLWTAITLKISKVLYPIKTAHFWDTIFLQPLLRPLSDTVPWTTSRKFSVRGVVSPALTLCYTLVTPFVYLDNDGSSVLQPILSKITM